VRMNRLISAVLAVFLVVGVSMGLSGTAADGQTAPATGATPTGPKLQAEILKTIDASQANVGDEVTAKTVTPLEFGGAKFPSGATVIGHVTRAEPSRLVLVFDHIVVKKNAPVPVGLSLRAIMMPQPPPQSNGEQISPRESAGGGGSAANPGIQDPRGRGDLLRSPEAAAQDSAVTVFPNSGPVETGNGGVVGLPGVQLGVSSDPHAGASFQVAKDHKLRLEKGLQMMFVVSK
jgi:hypothetical protein